MDNVETGPRDVKKIGQSIKSYTWVCAPAGEKDALGNDKHYMVMGYKDPENGLGNKMVGELHFQAGAIKEVGINGVMIEDLIAMCLDQLEQFQASKFKSRENAVAITHLETAMLWLAKRTMDRVGRGVEGTHTV